MRHRIRNILLEALRDDIPEYIAKSISSNQKSHLSRDVFQHTEKIPNGKWKLTDKEKSIAIRNMFDINISESQKLLDSIRQETEFIEMLNKALINPDMEINFSDFDIIQMKYIYKPIFMNISKRKDTGEITFSKNQPVNINKFIKSYNRVMDANISNIFEDSEFTAPFSNIKDINFDMEKLFDNPMYLYITDKPDDILRMSISQFYDSCMNLYSGGERGRLLSNVFDPNMKVAYLILDIPYDDKEGNEHPFTAFCRMILRKVKSGIFFDQAYPDRMKNIFDTVVSKYAGIKHKNAKKYDIDVSDILDLPDPYMDKLKINKTYSSINSLDIKQQENIVAEYPEAIKYIKNPSEDFQIEAVKNNGSAIQDIIEAGIKPSERVQIESVKNNEYAIQYIINAGIKPSEQVQIEAMKSDGNLIYYIIDAGIQPSERVQLEAINNYIGAIRYIIEAGIQPSERVQLESVKNYRVAIKYIIDAGIIPSERVQIEAMKSDGDAIQYIIKAGIKPSEQVQMAARIK